MACIWDTVERVFFEGGVALRRVDAAEWRVDAAEWRCEAAIQHLSLSPADFSAQYGLRPITAQLSGYNAKCRLVFPACTGRFLDVQLSQLHELIAKNAAEYFQVTRSLMHLLDAVIYHTQRLVDHYVNTVASHIDSPHHTDKDWAMAGSDEAFFEFDALVTAAIRALDSTRYLIWRTYGQTGSVPSSLSRTIKGCQRLPDAVKQRVTDIWDDRLTHAKEYRDCIQHYVAVGSETWAKLIRINSLFWTMRLRIPDNPEAKAAAQFTFDRGLDALTYAWELVSDLIALAALFIETTLVDSESRCRKGI